MGHWIIDEAASFLPLRRLPRYSARYSETSIKVAQAVEVELRLFRADEARYGTRLIPEAVPAVIRANVLPEPVVMVRDGDGEEIPYTAAEYQEEAPGASILVCDAPTPEQVQLLRLAAEFGFPIEPRVAGEPWREIEERE